MKLISELHRNVRVIGLIGLISLIGLINLLFVAGCKENSTATTPTPTAAVVITPSPIDFGAVSIGVQQSVAVTIRNNSALHQAAVAAFAVAGADSGMFTFPAVGSLPIVDPQNSITFNARFTPTRMGEISTTLAVTIATDSAPIHLTVALRGTGSAGGSICVDDTLLDCGTVAPDPAGKSFIKTALWIKNCGTAPIVFPYDTAGGTTVTTISVDNPYFTVVQNKYRDTRQPGDSTKITIIFAPHGSGPSTATLTIGSPSVASPTHVTLTGNGSADGWPTGSAPADLDLGTIPIFTDIDTSFYVHNPLATPITLNGLKEAPLNVVTMYHDYFLNPQVILGGDSLQIKFRIRLFAAGTFSDNFIVSFLEASGYTIKLTGKGN